MTQVINEKIGAWLLEKGNSQEKLANTIGITRPTLRSRLNGETKWTWEEVVKVAKTTDTTLNELAGIKVESTS